MFEPAAVPVVVAQVSETIGAAKGLQEGGAYFIASVLGVIVFALYRENRALSAQLLTATKQDNDAKIALVKEILPIAQKMGDAIPALERIVDKLTRE